MSSEEKKTNSVEETETSNVLAARAMLLSLSMGSWNYKKQNRKVANEVEQTKQARHGTCKVNTLLVSKEVLAKVESVRGAARAYLYSVTAPWRYGVRIVSSEIVLDVLEKLKEHKAMFLDAVEEFMNSYDAVVAEAPRRLKGLFNPADFPNKEELEKKFHFDVRLTALPDEQHVIVQLSDDAVSEIKKEMKVEQEEALALAMKDVGKRIHDYIKHMADTLNSDNSNFRTSLVGNVLDMADRIPLLNFAGDPRLTELQKEIQGKLARFGTPSAFVALKQDDAVREEAAQEADALARKLAQYDW